MRRIPGTVSQHGGCVKLGVNKSWGLRVLDPIGPYHPVSCSSPVRDCISSGDPARTVTHGSQQLVKLTKQATRDCSLTGLSDFIEMTVATQPAGSCSFLTSARTRDHGKVQPFSACISSSWFPLSEEGQTQDVFQEEALSSNGRPYSLVCIPSQAQPDAHPEQAPGGTTASAPRTATAATAFPPVSSPIRFTEGYI